MAKWKDTYKQVPPYNVTVWVRIYNYYGPPIKAKRIEDNRMGNYFELIPTNIRLPEWAAFRWKNVT